MDVCCLLADSTCVGYNISAQLWTKNRSAHISQSSAHCWTKLYLVRVGGRTQRRHEFKNNVIGGRELYWKSLAHGRRTVDCGLPPKLMPRILLPKALSCRDVEDLARCSCKIVFVYFFRSPLLHRVSMFLSLTVSFADHSTRTKHIINDMSAAAVVCASYSLGCTAIY